MDNKELALRAVSGVMPNGIKVTHGNTVIEEAAAQTEAIRSYIRSKVLRQFGITQVNNHRTDGSAILFNEVQTRLKLPSVKTTPAGEYAENLPEYYNRVLPEVKKWFANAIRNSGVTFEQVMDIQ